MLAQGRNKGAIESDFDSIYPVQKHNFDGNGAGVVLLTSADVC